MALQHLRSSTANKRPDPAAMADGQLALNTANASPGLFYKDATGSLIKAGPVHIGATAPNASPAVGGSVGNSVGEAWLDTAGTNPLLKIWNGSVWQTVQPVVNGTVVSTADTGSVTSTMILDGTIVNADINASAAIVDTKLATIATAGKVSNSATTATSANTNSAIVARDASGNFSAGTITAALTGAASSNVLKAGDTMTGALATPLGSATTPSLTFTGDLNTGIYSPGADQVAVATNGTGRLFVDGNGLIYAGHTSSTTSFESTILRLQVVGNSSTLSSAGLLRFSNDSFSPLFCFSKSRSTTVGTYGASLISGDSLGSIIFAGDDGIRGIRGAAIAAAVDSAPGIDSMPGRLVFSTTPSGSAAQTERLRITSAGLVGIGTSSPKTTLHVVGNISNNENSFASSNLYFDGAAWRFAANGYGGFIKLADAAGYMSFVMANAINSSGADAAATINTRMVITPAGNVGIGTTSPATTLDVNGDVTIADKIIHGGDTNTAIRFPAADTVSIETSGSERARIDSSGRLLVGTSTAFTSVNQSPSILLATTNNLSGTIGIGQFASTNFGAYLDFMRSDSGVVGQASGGAVATNGAIGALRFNGSDGTEFRIGATIAAISDGQVWANADCPTRLVFSTTADGASTPTERMRITNNGGTFITGAGTSLSLSNTDAAGTTSALVAGRHSATAGIAGSGTLSFIVYTNGNVVNTNNSYGAISDLKLKENIVDANSQWDDLKALQVRNYNFKEGQTHTQIGLVAQEVELVSPGLVSESPDLDEEGNDLGTVTKSVNYSVLYMKAVKALQEAMERIEILEQRLNDAGIN